MSKASFKAGSHYVVQVGLKLKIFLPEPLELWDCGSLTIITLSIFLTVLEAWFSWKFKELPLHMCKCVCVCCSHGASIWGIMVSTHVEVRGQPLVPFLTFHILDQELQVFQCFECQWTRGWWACEVPEGLLCLLPKPVSAWEHTGIPDEPITASLSVRSRDLNPGPVACVASVTYWPISPALYVFQWRTEPWGARGKAQQLRVLPAQRYQSSVPRTYVRWLTAACNSCSRGWASSFGLCGHVYMCGIQSDKHVN